MFSHFGQTEAPIFILAPGAELARELNLPSKSTNLFHRLIRNPHIERYWAKERECAEMLCAVLQNAPTLRMHLLSWLGALVGSNADALGKLRFTFDTEQPVGRKRDDLRIAGYAAEGHDLRARLLWSIEVKVGASFHESVAQLSGEEDDRVQGEEAPADAEHDARENLVNQLRNYDDWLMRQQAEHRAGFVLALRNCTRELPQLTCKWACVTWTSLGEQIASALRTIELPDSERLLARHALGFIRENLWRTSEMSDLKLNYNDVSLIRAFAMLADDCEAKVNALIASLADVLEESGIGQGPTRHILRLFKSSRRYSAVSRSLTADVAVMAGIGGHSLADGDYLSVWVQSTPEHAQKDALKARLNELKHVLLTRNGRWRFTSSDSSSGDQWTDVELTVPLAFLLAADDQQQALVGFVSGALEDLKASGVIDAYNNTVARNSRR